MVIPLATHSEEEHSCSRFYPNTLEIPYSDFLRNNTREVCNAAYAVTFFEGCKIPIFAWERLSYNDLEENVDRIDSFRIDKRVDGRNQLSPDDYRHSGYDRGHMAPSDNYKKSERDQRDTFLMTNITPQPPKFNRVIWRAIELRVQQTLKLFGEEELIIVTGNAFINGENIDMLSNKGGCIPQVYFKLILKVDGRFVSAYIVKINDNLSNNPDDYQLNEKEFEKLTGFNIP